MLGRRTTRLLGIALGHSFYRSAHVGQSILERVRTDELYDFLYDHDFDQWFCDFARRCREQRNLVDMVMRLQTGEAITASTPSWTTEARTAWCHDVLLRLAKVLVQEAGGLGRRDRDDFKEFVSSLELDGYAVRDGKLLPAESETNEVQVETGELSADFARLGLPNSGVVAHHLKECEDQYVLEKWGACVHESRQYLEQVLQSIAVAWSGRPGEPPVSDAKKPVVVRDYLKTVGLLKDREHEVVRTLYGLLSEVGGHPGMSEHDQARVFRRLALTISQFALLRYENRIKPSPAP